MDGFPGDRRLFQTEIQLPGVHVLQEEEGRPGWIDDDQVVVLLSMLLL